MNMLIKEDIKFTNLPAGYIKPMIMTRVTRNFYDSNIDIFRGVLECLFILLASIYFTRTMRRWYLKWKEYMSKVFSKQSEQMKANNL